MRRVTLLEVLDDAERVQVVVEAPAVMGEAPIKRAFAGVAERGMADVVDEGERLGEIFIQAERCRGGAGNLCDLDGMGQSASKVIGGATGKYLRLSCEPAEGTGLHNALPIALEGRARGPQGRGIDAGQQEIIGISRDCASMEIDWHSQI
jgi:hypothetical protein